MSSSDQNRSPSRQAPPRRILVLGATGMLGNALVRLLAADGTAEVIAGVRGHDAERLFRTCERLSFIGGLDAESPDSLARVMAAAEPDVVINAVGVVKQLNEAKSVLASVPINALLPHRMARLCLIAGARLIHVSTDCVFSGAKGSYVETDTPDATDVYGMSKLLGEVTGPGIITLRTSIIGHELRGRLSLLEWFLAQPGPVRGFTKAVFSGLPTIELARVIRDFVLPRPDLTGLYHVSAAPIAKFDLLRLIARCYGKDIEIEPESQTVIDRSLESTRFRQATGYQSREWPELIAQMHEFG